MKHRLIIGLFLLLTGTLLIGCGSDAKLSGLVPCTGTVLMDDGSPVTDASIMLSPKNSGGALRSASGKTDANGKFVMSTLNKNDGVMPGEYVVVVLKTEEYGPEPAPLKDEDGNEYVPLRPTRNLLPDQYDSSTTSPLNLTIPSCGNENLEIKLEK